MPVFGCGLLTSVALHGDMDTDTTQQLHNKLQLANRWTCKLQNSRLDSFVSLSSAIFFASQLTAFQLEHLSDLKTT